MGYFVLDTFFASVCIRSAPQITIVATAFVIAFFSLSEVCIFALLIILAHCKKKEDTSCVHFLLLMHFCQS